MRVRFENRKVKWLLGILLTAACPISCLAIGASTKAGLVLMVMALAVTALRLEVTNKRALTWLYTALFFASPCVTYFLGLLMQNIDTSNTTLFRILMNIGIVFTISLIVLLLCSNIRSALVIGAVLPLGLTLVNSYVYSFRGNSLTPTDVLSFQTAANVAAEYDFTPSTPMLYALLLTAIFLLMLFCLPYFHLARTKNSILAELSIVTLCIAFLSLGSANVKPRYWQNYGALYNGYILNFALQIRDVFVAKPTGYSDDLVNTLEAGYPAQNANSTTPDIIVIMDESFADFRVFDEDYAGDTDIIPYIDALSENTIRGYLNASVFGGSTANSEYEFLSGNTMAFLPQGSMVYQQYYSEEIPTLVSILKHHGYDCIAMHPYYANGWMRDTVYPKMGFEELYFLEDFPSEQMVREYVSDQEMFEQIIRLHQTRDADTPMFLFGVTMQNHGGYAYEGTDFETTVSLDGLSGDYPMAEQYLTLAQETDKAVEYLIEYYKTIDRDVVIVFFGDHMPNVEPEFYEELNGGTFDTLDEQMKKQMVPFFVWANYDIGEREVPCSSINYLSLYTLEAAGIPLPPYYQFLKETESVIPAINAYGYYSLEQQRFLPLEDASGNEAAAIRDYGYLQYNNMFDEEHRSEHFFGK